MRFPIPTLLLTLTALASSVVAQGKIGIIDGKLTVGAADGSDSQKYEIISLKGVEKEIVFQRDTVLKFSFTVVDSSSSEGVVPQQAHMLIKEEGGREVGMVVVGVKGDGKGRFDLKSSTLPPLLTSSPQPLSLTLLLASPPLAPLSLPLLTLRLPQSLLTPPAAPRHGEVKEGEPSFVLREEIRHVFGVREEEAAVSGWKWVVGAGGVVMPWGLLGSLIGKTTKHAQWKAPPMSVYVFLASLVVIEGLIVKYWINWTLGGFLPYFAGFSALSIYLGKIALSSVQARRLSSAPVTAPVVPVEVEKMVEEVKEKVKEGVEKVKEVVASVSAGEGVGEGKKKKKSKK